MAWLSILAPAYRYPDGTQRILEALSPLPDGVELLISDNTPNKSVSDVVARYESPNLQYWCNTPALEAVPNWNLLLDRATGDYVMLLHHDEVPLGRDYLALLRATIEATDADVLVQSILLMDASMRPLRPHVPLWLRDWVIRRTPGYLFRRHRVRVFRYGGFYPSAFGVAAHERPDYVVGKPPYHRGNGIFPGERLF